MKTKTLHYEVSVPESKAECEGIACVDCLYVYDEPDKCFENRGEADDKT